MSLISQFSLFNIKLEVSVAVTHQTRDRKVFILAHEVSVAVTHRTRDRKVVSSIFAFGCLSSCVQIMCIELSLSTWMFRPV